MHRTSQPARQICIRTYLRNGLKLREVEWRPPFECDFGQGQRDPTKDEGRSAGVDQFDPSQISPRRTATRSSHYDVLTQEVDFNSSTITCRSIHKTSLLRSPGPGGHQHAVVCQSLSRATRNSAHKNGILTLSRSFGTGDFSLALDESTSNYHVASTCDPCEACSMFTVSSKSRLRTRSRISVGVDQRKSYAMDTVLQLGEMWLP